MGNQNRTLYEIDKPSRRRANTGSVPTPTPPPEQNEKGHHIPPHAAVVNPFTG
jgi:hypothetical protein